MAMLGALRPGHALRRIDPGRLEEYGMVGRLVMRDGNWLGAPDDV